MVRLSSASHIDQSRHASGTGLNEQMAETDRELLHKFAQYASEHTDDFVGREWVFKRLHRWLADRQAVRFFVIQGNPGSGKTAIAARIFQFSSGAIAAQVIRPLLRRDVLSAAHFCYAQNSLWIDPLTFAESLAFQLAPRYLPSSLLNQSDAPMTINSIQHVQNALAGSQVANMLIHHLSITAPSPVHAFLRIVRKPLETLYAAGYKQRITILIDGLDESLGQSAGLTILDLLADAQTFPPQVRFIVTTCPVQTVLEQIQQAGAEICDLSAESNLAHSNDDIERSIKRWLNQPQLRSKLAPTLSSQQFIALVKDKSGTNFLYLRHLLNMLAARKQLITQRVLTSFPDTLHRLYVHSLQRVLGRHRDKWESADAQALGMLAVAQEPLTQGRLSDLTGMSRSAVGYSLARVQPFLKTPNDCPPDDPAYTLYQSAFAAFLLDRSHPHEFYCDPQDYHARISDYYDRWWKASCVLVSPGFDLEQINRHDGYPFRYLSLHLHCALKPEALLRLIKDWRWYTAQSAYDVSEASYLSDVRLAWQSVESATRKTIKRTRRVHRLSDEIYCALVVASYHSRADNVPPQLVIRVLESYTGHLDGVLATVRHISDRAVLTKVFAALAQRLPLQERPAVLREVLALTLTLVDEDLQADTLITIGPMIPADLMREVVAMVQRMHDPNVQVTVLQDLLPRIAELEGTEHALAQLQQVVPEQRMPLLVRIAPSLSQPQVDQVLELVRTAPAADPAQRVQALGALCTRLVALGDPHTALECAQLADDPAERALVLAQFLPVLAEAGLASAALAVAHTIPNSEQRSLILTALLPAIASQGDPQQALNIALALTNQQQRVRVMSALVPALPLSLRARALEEIRALDWRQAHCLIDLAPALPESWLDQAIDAAERLSPSAERSAALIGLLCRLVDLGNASEAYQLAQTMLLPAERVRAYSHLLPGLIEFTGPHAMLAAIPTSACDADQIMLLQSLLPYLTALADYDELLSVIAAIESPRQRMHLLGVAATHLPSAFIEKAFDQTRMIGDHFAHPISREAFLARLAESGHADKALKAARTLEDRQERAQMLCALLSFVPEVERAAVLDEALATITGPPEQQIQDLQRLIGKLPADLQLAVTELAWSIAPQIDDIQRRLAAFAVWLRFTPPEQRPARVAAACVIVNTLDDRRQRVAALVGLAPFLDQQQQRQALETVWNLRDEADQARALAELAAHLPAPLLREAVSVAWLFRDAGEAALVPLLTALGKRDGIDEALAGLKQIKSAQGLAQGLIELAPYFSTPQLRDALRSAWEIHHRAWKNKAIAHLLFHLAKSGHQDEAFESVWMLEDEQGKVEALLQLTPELNYPWVDQARLLLESLEPSWQREQALVSLAGRMAELAEIDTALDIVNRLEQPQQMAEAVAKVARHVPTLSSALVQRGFEAASTIEDTAQRTAIFAELATPLMKLPHPQLYEVWCNTLRCSSQRSRVELHADLCALAPIIALLGDSTTIRETASALATIGEWWP